MSRPNLSGGIGDGINMAVESDSRAEVEDAPEIPYGKNPYFSETVSSGEDADQGLEGVAEGSEDELEAQGQEEPVPTFDPAQDRAAGIDVEHPYYQKALAEIKRAAEQARQQDEPDVDLEAKKRQVEEQTAHSTEIEVPELAVSWEGFQVNQFEADSPLHGLEGDLARVVREHIEFAVASVNRQNKEIAQQQVQLQTRNYISAIIDEIGKVAGPQAKGQAIDLLQEYAPLAKSAPQKWARFVVRELGIDVNGSAQAAEPAATNAAKAPPARKTASQVRSQSVPPSAPRAGGAASRTPRFDGPTATRDAISWALDKALKGQI